MQYFFLSESCWIWPCVIMRYIFFDFCANFFNCWQIVDWYMLRSSTNSRVFLHGLHSNNFLKASWSGVLGFSQWRIAKTKLWKSVSDLAANNNTLAINTGNFLSCFWSAFVILKLPHYISNMPFQFLHFRGARLNYDVHLFISEIRIKTLFNQVISGCI